MAPPSLFAYMRIYWKSSLILTPALFAGTYFTYDYILNKDMMKYFCRKAADIGDKKLSSVVQPEQINVILNPEAGKRKSKKLFEKWSEPLFNLAGMKVNVIETKKANESLDIKKLLSDCDGIAIVGGDGTVEEMLGSLVEEGSDSTEVLLKYPIAIIPTGKENTIAKKVQDKLEYRNHKEFIVKSTMNAINKVLRKPSSET